MADDLDPRSKVKGVNMIERSKKKLVWYPFEFVRDFLYTAHAP